jgi:hypothetical protein
MRRQDADNPITVMVKLNALANYIGIAAELGLPEFVRKHHDALLGIGFVHSESPTELRLKIKNGEKARRNLLGTNISGFATASKSHIGGEGHDCGCLERSESARLYLRCRGMTDTGGCDVRFLRRRPNLPGRSYARCGRHARRRQRAKNAAALAEDGGIRANAERKRQHNNSGEARGLRQHPDCGPNVLNQRAHGIPLLRQDRKRNSDLAVSIRGPSLTRSTLLISHGLL